MKSLPKSDATKVYEKSELLAENPRPAGCKKLSNSKEQMWRIRVGDYRLLYTIEDQVKIVDIRRVGHRKDIYDLNPTSIRSLKRKAFVHETTDFIPRYNSINLRHGYPILEIRSPKEIFAT